MITSLAPLSPHQDLFYTEWWLIMFRARVRFYIYTLENAPGTFLEHKLVVWCSHNPNVVCQGPAMTCSPLHYVFYKTVNWMNCLLRGGAGLILIAWSRIFPGLQTAAVIFSLLTTAWWPQLGGLRADDHTPHTDNTWSCQACVLAMLTLFLDPDFINAR